jgi:ABC-type sugar transport system substrate-binding protein
MVTHPEVDAIFLDSDWLGSGITAYLESSGHGRVGEDNHIYYVGVGGMPQALDYIREGWMDLTINNPVPDFAGAAVEVAYTLVTGQSLGAEWVQEGAPWSPAAIAVAVPTDDKPYAGPVLNMQNFIVDTSNVDDPMLWGNIVAEQ